MKTIREASIITGIPTGTWYHAASQGIIPLDNSQPITRVSEAVIERFAEEHKKRILAGKRQGHIWEPVRIVEPVPPDPLDEVIRLLEKQGEEITAERARVQDEVDTVTLRLYELEDMAKKVDEQIATIRNAQAITQKLKDRDQR